MPKKTYGKQTGRPITHALPTPAGGVRLETFVPWVLVKRGYKKQIITPLDAPQEFLSEATREREARVAAQDTALMRALGLAHHWQRLLDERRFISITEIAATEGIDRGQASKIAQLARIAPDIVDACATGKARGITLQRLTRSPVPVTWDVQRAQYGRSP